MESPIFELPFILKLLVNSIFPLSSRKNQQNRLIKNIEWEKIARLTGKREDEISWTDAGAVRYQEVLRCGGQHE